MLIPIKQFRSREALLALVYVGSLLAAAVLWSVAFVLYLWIFTPWLMQTRLDGKDG